jgi:phosphohistidine phosphatase
VKTLLLLRHAKAQPDAPEGDKRRSLTNRGKRDARAIAELVARLHAPPEVVITSDAKRARQTAKFVSESVVREPSLYGADAEELLDFVRALPDAAASVMLVGHNPGFEDLCSALAEPAAHVGHLPTAAIGQLEFRVERWRDIGPGTGNYHMITGT